MIATHRLALFTDDELYAINNALDFSQPSFADKAIGPGQWAHEWQENRAVAEYLRQEVRSELRHREGH